MWNEAKHAHRAEEVLGKPVKAIVVGNRMNLPGSGLWIWAAAGIGLGMVLDGFFGLLNESIAIGVGVGVGLAFGMWVMDRRLRNDPAIPGGISAHIAVTATDVALLDLGFWGRSRDVTARYPIETVSTVLQAKERSGFVKTDVVSVVFQHGETWRFQIKGWDRIAAHLPERLAS